MHLRYRNVYKITRSRSRQNEYGDLYNSREDADDGQATTRDRLGVELIAQADRKIVVFYWTISK